jgi:two-component system response regulator AtoC
VTRILYIEDDEEIRDNVSELLSAEGFTPVTAATGEEGLRVALEDPPDLILCDISLPGMDGYAVIRAVSEYPQTETIPFIFVSARADRAEIRHGMNLGADDYVTKPFGRVELLDAIRSRLSRTKSFAARAGRPAEAKSPQSAPDAKAPPSDADMPPGVIVKDPAMRALYDQLARVAVGDISVLILGETGAGKEIVAREVHRRSKRSAAPFVALNCAALPENLLESELFGHEKGAFTGAMQAQRGLLETADKGTVFLDELGEIPLAVQVKLLRAIEERKILRVGGRGEKTIDVRFVAATNRNLERDVERGTFRADLFYRLSGFVVEVPPLRDRRPEIAALARKFLADASRALERTPPSIDADAIEILESYAWPGNVRELRNVMERASLLCSDERLEARHLPTRLLEGARGSVPPPAPDAAREGASEPRGDGSLREGVALAERDRIIGALAHCAGNQTQAAARLGISRRTLVSRLSEYELPRPRKRGA